MFLVIDGSSLACTEYYKTCPFYQDDWTVHKEECAAMLQRDRYGRYTNAVEGFFTVLFDLMEQYHPSYLAVCFDTSREKTFRREVYAPYKANRGEKPYPLIWQIGEIKSLLQTAGIPVLESARYEADDYAGSLAKQFSVETDVYLYTKDRDYLQLIGPHVTVWLKRRQWEIAHLMDCYGTEITPPKGCFAYTEGITESEFGILPSQVTDLKGLSGDVSDNIPGVKGVSDRTAIPLLRRYGNLEGIYRELDACRTEKEKKMLGMRWKEELFLARSPVDKLITGKSMAFLSRELARIRCDLPVGKLCDYRLHPDYEGLAWRLEQYDLRELSYRASLLQNG